MLLMMAGRGAHLEEHGLLLMVLVAENGLADLFVEAEESTALNGVDDAGLVQQGAEKVLLFMLLGDIPLQERES